MIGSAVRGTENPLMEPNVYAYLDPGSGSMILQALLGGAAAVAVVAKLSWRRLLTLLRIRKRDDEHL